MRTLIAPGLGLAIGAAASGAQAATIETGHGNGGKNGPLDYDRLIAVTGDIVDGDSVRLEEALQGSHHAAVFLVSDGGLAIEGIKIGKEILRSGASTYVPPNEICASACALAWLAGSPRVAGLHAKILFHHATNIDNDRDSEDQANAVIGGYLSSLGMRFQAIAFMTEKGPNDSNQLTVTWAAALGIQAVFDERDSGVDLAQDNACLPPPKENRSVSPPPPQPYPLRCSNWTAISDDGFVNVRARPSINANILWTLKAADNGQGNGAIKWCGEERVEQTAPGRGIHWRWVSFLLQNETWEHKGWVAGALLKPYP